MAAVSEATRTLPLPPLLALPVHLAVAMADWVVASLGGAESIVLCLLNIYFRLLHQSNDFCLSLEAYSRKCLALPSWKLANSCLLVMRLNGLGV